MNKSLVSILFFLLVCLISFGQEKYSKTVSLQWEERSFDYILEENARIWVLTFEGAAFDAHSPEVPRYLQNIPLPGNGSIQISVTPIKTSPISITKEESKAKVGQDFITNLSITQERDTYQGNISITPIRKTNDGFEKLDEFQWTVTFTPKSSSTQGRNGNTFTSVLSEGTFYKIPIKESGVYAISGDYLASIGISNGSLDSEDIQVYTYTGGRLPTPIDTDRIDDLIEIPIQINDNGDGKIDQNDNIIFYAEGADRWYFDDNAFEYVHDKNIYDIHNFVFLRTDGSNGKRVATVNSLSDSDYASTAFDFLQIHEEDRTNLLGTNSGTEGTGKDWYGDYFAIETSRSYESLFDISNIADTDNAKIKMRLAARGQNTTTTNLTVGSQAFSKKAGSTTFSDIEADYAREVIIDEEISITPGTTINVEFAKSGSKDEAWLDYILLEYRRIIDSKYDQLRLSDKVSIEYNTAGFSVPVGYQYWQVTDIGETKIINPVNSMIRYNVDNRIHTFYMVRNNSFLQPEAGGSMIPNQNVHRIDRADLIIMYHPDFKAAAEKLADHRRNHNNYIVETVNVLEVYNEFSGGRLDPTAIRDFSRMLSLRDPNYRYLLLLGDGSYDYRNITPDLADHNFIPPYETDESLDPINGFPTDDYYALLSDGEGDDLRGAIDIAVGRIPVSEASVANGVIDKIINYDTNTNALGDWRLKLAFAADDEDGNLHVDQTDEIAESLELQHPIYNQSKIYYDAYVQESTPGGDRYPAASDAINTAVQNGTLILNYLGHGGPRGWAQERVLKISDIETWNNPDRLPVLITATCSFTGYDDPSIVSAGEATIQKTNGGVLALLTTVRAVYASENKRLAQAVFDTIFDKVNGEAQTLGDIITKAKNRNADSNNVLNDRKFALIGDPSQRLALPRYNIETTAINDQPIAVLDTLNALDKVTIKGIITDEDGNVIRDFNGNVFPTVYDKESSFETLRNDPRSEKNTFEVYRNILFKGSATVVNGEFEFTFVLPKDINYTIGTGRISYYAHDGARDAAGNFNEILIGGSNPNAVIDDEGPSMSLFMNDEKFVFGGSTDSDPTLLVKLSDDLGINVSGTSIGHDITAILDEDVKNAFILNEFYEANKDDHTSGQVRYQLNDLEPGRHSIRVKAWDVSNNSTEETLEFVVIEDDDESLRKVLNYPNPFIASTTFQFEHDLAGSDLEVYIDIYSVSGQLVKTIQRNIFASGYRVDDIQWDAQGDYGIGLGKGLYLYKIKVVSKELNLIRESDFEKLVIL